MPHKVFVYGSLMSGMPNHARMRDAILLSKDARTENPEYELHELVEFSFPSAIRSPMGTTLFGEVYHVSDQLLAMMDYFEGHPDFFKRQEVQIVLDGSEPFTCWIYEGPESLSIEGLSQSVLIESGDWRKHYAERTGGIEWRTF